MPGMTAGTRACAASGSRRWRTGAGLGSSFSAHFGVTEGSHDEDHDDLNSAAWTADLKFSEAVIFGHDSIYWIAAEVHLR